MKWITRANVKVDRVACPWLIKKFVDPDAEFHFVPADRVSAEAARLGAIPFDVPDVELGHHDGKCSFEAVLTKYRLADPALHLLAKIVHGADVKDDLYHPLKPPSAGRAMRPLPAPRQRGGRRVRGAQPAALPSAAGGSPAISMV